MRWLSALGAGILGAIVCSSALPATAQEEATWERGEDGSVTYADLALGRYERFTVFCRKTSTGTLAGLALSAPQFQTRVIDKQGYDLTLVIDGGRDSFHLVARSIELWFEATDLNQQNHLALFFDRLITAQRIDLAVSTLGWRESRIVANSDSLAGLLDKCL